MNDPVNWVDPFGLEAQAGPAWKNLGSPSRRRTEKEQRAHEFALKWAGADREALRTIDRAQRNYDFAARYTVGVRNASAATAAVVGAVVAAPVVATAGSSALTWVATQGGAAVAAVGNSVTVYGSGLAIASSTAAASLQQAYVRGYLALADRAPIAAQLFWNSNTVDLARQGISAAAPAQATGVVCTPRLRDFLLERAKDPRVRDLIDQLWRPGARLGNGSSMDAFRIEGSHLLKLLQRRANIMKWIRDAELGAGDRSIVRTILIDIQNALSGLPGPW